MNGWTLGVDTSHWTGTINFATMYNAGARWWITKATDAYSVTGQQFEDSRFDGYCKDAFAFGKLLTGCYHWLQASVDPIVAADFYLERYNRYAFDFPPVLDFEETSVRTTGKFSDYAWRAQMWCKRVEEVTGRKPIIYTAKWYTSYFTEKMIGWMRDYPLWVADYSWWANNVTKTPYYMPAVWDEWTMWQYSADNNNRGKEFGVDARDIDLNWFKGSYDELLAWLGVGAPEPDEEDVLFRAKVIVAGLNVRSTPVYYSDNRNKVGELRRDDVVEVYQTSGDWFRIGVNRWVNGHPVYMKRLPDPEPPELTHTIEERLMNAEVCIMALKEQTADLERRVTALEAR